MFLLFPKVESGERGKKNEDFEGKRGGGVGTVAGDDDRRFVGFGGGGDGEVERRGREEAIIQMGILVTENGSTDPCRRADCFAGRRGCSSGIDARSAGTC